MLEPVTIYTGLVLTLSLVFPWPVPVEAQTDPVWIGKLIVQKYRDFSLTVNDEPVERNSGVPDIYKVERTDGSLLWLKAETLGSSGWAKARMWYRSTKPSTSLRTESRRNPLTRSPTPSAR